MPSPVPVWAERVKQLRQDRKWSQAVLAERAGLSLATIRGIEEGANTTTDSLQAVAAALEVTIQALICYPRDVPRLTEFQINRLTKSHMAIFREHLDEFEAIVRRCIDQGNDRVVREQAKQTTQDPHTTTHPPTPDEKEARAAREARGEREDQAARAGKPDRRR